MLLRESDQLHVLIIGDGSLFHEGVTSLFTQETDMLISYTTCPDDLVFVNSIEVTKPDVIVVNESGSLDAERFLNLISMYALVMSFLIVIVRNTNDLIDIYNKPAFGAETTLSNPQQVRIRTGDELVRVVREKYKGQR